MSPGLNYDHNGFSLYESFTIFIYYINNFWTFMKIFVFNMLLYKIIMINDNKMLSSYSVNSN